MRHVVGAARLRRCRDSRRWSSSGLARVDGARSGCAIRSPTSRPRRRRRTLTPDQARRWRPLQALAPGEAALLFGVTGSGKTLVYLEAVRRVLAAGRGAIVLVPEIGLTPQTVSRFRGAFGDEVAVLHSGLSDGERADAWRLLRRGERRVAVGARSAVFAPVQDLGMIVVDEEHEASYKNGEAPRYHTRDVAAVRARIEGATLGARQRHAVAGDDGPDRDRLRLLRLPERIGARPLPPVEIVDLRDRAQGRGHRTGGLVRGAGRRRSSAPLARGEQALLLLNRRGYAAFLQCPDCGEVWQCPHCTISLTVHRAPAGLRCHYCGHEEPLPFTCRGVRQPGAADARRRHPAAGAGAGGALSRARGSSRMDLDTTSTKWSHQRILGCGGAGRGGSADRHPDDRQGTGFPQRDAGGCGGRRHRPLSARTSGRRSGPSSCWPRWRAAPAAGRKGGRVLVQTRHPQHHALIWSARHDTEGFLREELELRRAPPYPPDVHLVNLVVSGADEARSRLAAPPSWPTGARARGAARAADHGARTGALPAGADQGPVALARAAEGATVEVLGRVVRYAARRLPGRERRGS